MTRRADATDKPVVLDILNQSFATEPSLNWMLSKSRNKRKLALMLDYIFEETLAKGEIYITNDCMATAMWFSQEREKVTLAYIKRTVSLILKIGLISTIRSLRVNAFTFSQFPKTDFFYLYMLGVKPQAQGKGLASILLNSVLDSKKKEGLPVYLQTATPTNLDIYKNKGFKIDSEKIFGKGEMTMSFMRFN